MTHIYEINGDCPCYEGLEEKAMVGALKIEGHYDAKKNVTTINTKLKDGEDEEKEETLLGLVILKLVTSGGVINAAY